MSRNIDVSKSYKADTISFDATEGTAVLKGFTADNVHDALVEAKASTATTDAEGLVERATPDEVNTKTGSGYVAAEDLPGGNYIVDADFDKIAPVYFVDGIVSQNYATGLFPGAVKGTIVVYTELRFNGYIYHPIRNAAAMCDDGQWHQMSNYRDVQLV